MAVRKTGGDFQRDVAAQTVSAPAQVTFVAALNADNVSFKITRNGVAIYNTVLWNAQGSAAVTDAGGVNQDTVTVLAADGTVQVGAAQAFINALK